MHRNAFALRVRWPSIVILSIAACATVGCPGGSSGTGAGAGGHSASSPDAGPDTSPSTGGTATTPETGPSTDGSPPGGDSGASEPVVVTTPAWASAKLDQQGGVLTLANATLWIPPGNLNGPTLIQIGVTPADPNDGDTVGETYDLQPEGLTFSEPARLLIHRTLHTNGHAADDLVIATWSPADNSWVEEPSWSSNDDVAAKLAHFSKRAARKPKSKVPASPCKLTDRPNNRCYYECNVSTHRWEKTIPQQDPCGTTDRCFILPTDPDHCGSCDNKCSGGQLCSNGQCKCCGPTFPGTGSCVVDDTCPDGVDPDACKCTCHGKDKMTDPANCGECDNRCEAGKQCVAGFCVCVSSDGKVADLATDSNNCGSCGHVCGAGQSCVGGECGCRGKDLMIDPQNCGNCGVVCSTGEQCVAGSCVCVSGGTVVDLTTDRLNCGTCRHVCATGESCSAGVCGCSSTGLMTDRNNCGGCGIRCALGQDCVNGTCQQCTAQFYAYCDSTGHQVHCACDPSGDLCSQYSNCSDNPFCNMLDPHPAGPNRIASRCCAASWTCTP